MIRKKGLIFLISIFYMILFHYIKFPLIRGWAPLAEDGYVGRGRNLLSRGGRLIAHVPKVPGNFGAGAPALFGS